MKKVFPFILIFAIALFIGACGAQSPDKGDLSVSCASLQPSQGDVQYALDFGKELFTDINWQRTYMVQELQATVSWTHRTISALADVTVYMFCDDTGTDDITWFYNDQSLQVMFQGYEESRLVASCGKDKLLLYELEALKDGQIYNIHLWAEPLNKSRLLSVVVTFPQQETALLDQYGQEFFPQLPSCP